MRTILENKRLLFFAGIFLLLAFAQASTAEAGRRTEKVKTYASDSAITTELKAKYLAEKGLDSLDIKVKTTNGVVVLRGQVLRKSQSNLAEKIAWETKGVREVQNKISVAP